MTHSYLWHNSVFFFEYGCLVFWGLNPEEELVCVRVTWLVLCVCYNSFICMTWLIHTCDMTHSYLWHDSVFVLGYACFICLFYVLVLFVGVLTPKKRFFVQKFKKNPLKVEEQERDDMTSLPNSQKLKNLSSISILIFSVLVRNSWYLCVIHEICAWVGRGMNDELEEEWIKLQVHSYMRKGHSHSYG